jgi:predicted RecB family nuclease
MRFEVIEDDRPFRRRDASRRVAKASEPAFGVPLLDVSSVRPLNSYAAKSCPVKVQHRVAPPRVAPREVPDLEPFLQLGRDHEAGINEKVADELNVVEFDGDPASTLTQLEAGAPVVVGGVLPTDHAGKRSGRPDWLVRAQEPAASGKPGYWPVDLKAHTATAPAGAGSASRLPALASSLTEPFVEAAQPIPDLFETTNVTRRADLLQLAHYWRMLEACGHAPATDGGIWGGIADTGDHVVWTDLSARRFRAPGWLPDGRTPKRMLSALELYDIEFAYRLDIAAAAQAHVIDASKPFLVEPAKTRECADCRWWSACSEQLERDGGDVSLIPRIGPATASRLRAAGIRNRDDLAELDGAGRATLAKQTGIGNLASMADAAWVAVRGTSPLYRKLGVIDIAPPRADIEIDLDVEHDTPPFVYLWGTLLTNRSGRRFPFPEGYRGFVDWSWPGAKSDRALFSALWAWLSAVRAAATDLGLTVAIYCWTAAEQTRLRASAGKLRGSVERLLGSEGWVDLHAYVVERTVSADGTRVKQIAAAAGFSWRDDHPSGMASVGWFMNAVRGDENAKKRLLEYNEDDVRALLAIRDWLSSMALPALPDWDA